jgi:hypothetical protein
LTAAGAGAELKLTGASTTHHQGDPVPYPPAHDRTARRPTARHRTARLAAAALLLATGLAGAAPPGDLAAQGARTDFALGGGMGMLATGIPQAPALRGSLVWGHGAAIVTVRSLAATEWPLAGNPEERLFEAGLLLGRRTRGQAVDFAASAGVAWAGGMRRGEPVPLANPSGHPVWDLLAWVAEGSPHEEDPFGAIGVPLEAQLILSPLQRWQIGLVAFANLNSGRSFAGAAIETRLGTRRR